MKSTDEQIKELWEWCGFRYRESEDSLACYWEANDGRTWGYDLPLINLNNLFKYAVPKAYSVKIIIDYTKELVECKIKCFQRYYTGKGETEELALFWAIYKVMKEG